MKDIEEAVEKILQHIEGALPDEALDAFQDETLSTEQLREVLKNIPCEIDALTLIRIVQIMEDLPFKYKLHEAYEKRIEKINKIGSDVRKSKDKDTAYRNAADRMGWKAARKQDPLQSQTLSEYLDLIGIVYIYSEERAAAHGFDNFYEFIEKAAPEPMEKLQAIESLSKKYDVRPATIYKRIQRAKKKQKKELKSEKVDFSYLNGILPEHEKVVELENRLYGTD